MSRIREWIDVRCRRILGSFFLTEDETGHIRLCRFLKYIRNFGPSGTFCQVHEARLKSGGHICVFGTECGKPSDSYMRQMRERLEMMNQITRQLEAVGALVTNIWENPRFAVGSVCNCGKPDVQELPQHSPLCEYRVLWECQPTFDEYRALLAQATKQ